eukprot:9063118-Pyramimonas_sp.AAC.1
MASNLEIALWDLFARGKLPATSVQRLAQAAYDDGWGWKDQSLACRLRDCEQLEDAVSSCGLAFACGSWGHSKSALMMCAAGTHGANSHNVQRDLFRAAEINRVVDELPREYYMCAPGPGGSERRHVMYLPHEVIHHYRQVRGADTVLTEAELAHSPIGKLVREWCNHADVGVPEARAAA